MSGAASSGGWALFLDFDGTLADIAPRPDAVIVPPDLPPLLQRAQERCAGALAIVTGRSIDVIDGFLPGLALDVCGLHGLERRRGGAVTRVAVAHLEALRAAILHIQAELAPVPGVIVEDKGESVALHWRLAPEAAPLVGRVAADALARIGGGFRLQAGKAVAEIVPVTSGKGRAIESLLAEPPYLGRRPLFCGDDVTDEAGFAVVEARNGVGVKIGAGDTAASRRLADPSALRAWLRGFVNSRAGVDDLEAT